jgi:hypothetical protein
MSHYAVREPFRVLVKRGHSPSNTYIGSSRSYDPVFDALNAKPGDIVACYPGGTFLLREDGTDASISLIAPKHIFEKTYLVVTDEMRMQRAVEAGLAEPCEAPGRKPDFKRLQQESSMSFPEFHRMVNEIEPSPEFTALEAALTEASVFVEGHRSGGTRDDAGNPPVLHLSDMTTHDGWGQVTAVLAIRTAQGVMRPERVQAASIRSWRDGAWLKIRDGNGKMADAGRWTGAVAQAEAARGLLAEAEHILGTVPASTPGRRRG